jgi:hypothetical protein
VRCSFSGALTRALALRFLAVVRSIM